MINYYLLTKPGIVMGNLVTVAAGFLLASKGNIDIWLFFATLAGLAFIMASACIFNNYIDRKLDKKMQRTKDRALAIGLVSSTNALFLAACLGFAGGLILFAYTNLLTLFIAGIGFFVYVVLYSFWKCHTIYGTAIGSVAGAVPPVVGYCAVSNHFDLGALILFLMMVLWQMPHFFAIAVYHFDDYKIAGIPALPIVKGVFKTKVHSSIYIFAFILTAIMLTFFDYTGYVYFFVTLVLGGIWLGLSLKGFTTRDDQIWGAQMFRFSLLLITMICFVIPFDLKIQ